MGRGFLWLRVLLLGMAIIMPATPAYAAGEHWGGQEAAHLADMGMVSRVDPWAPLSRGQWVDLLVKSVALTGPPGQGFSDVRAGDPFYDAILLAQGAGWISGYPDGAFRAGEPVTRAEMAAMALRMGGEEIRETAKEIAFRDVGPEHWFHREAGEASRKGLIVGDGKGRFNPDRLADWGTGGVLLRLTLQKMQGHSVPDDRELEELVAGYENGALADLAAGDFRFPSAYPWVTGKAKEELDRLNREQGGQGKPIAVEIEEQYLRPMAKSSRLAMVRLYYIYRFSVSGAEPREVMGISDYHLWRTKNGWKIYRID